MKKVYILLILSLTIQYSYGQACGIYRIKYVGNIKSESFKIEKIILPTIGFLHGLENKSSEKGYIEVEPTTNKIDIELGSPMTSHLYKKAENLLDFYKEKRRSIPIEVIVIQNGKKKKIRIELAWDNIQITKLKDDKFGNLFELNLNEINVE